MGYKPEILQEAARIEKAKDWNALLHLSKGWSSSEPNNPLAWLAMGNAFRALGRPKEAILSFHKGIEVAPEVPTEMFGAMLSAAPLWYGLGHAYSEANQRESAINAFKNAACIEPLAADIWNDLGVAYVNSTDYDGALDAFKRAVSLSPGDVNSLRNLGVVYAICGAREGVEQIHSMLSAIDLNSAKDFLGQAKAIMSQGNGSKGKKITILCIILGILVMVISALFTGIIPAVIIGFIAGGALALFFKSKEDNTLAMATGNPESQTPPNFDESELQFNLGQAFRFGSGVPQNSEEAFSWIQKSARKGFSEAQNVLGFMYSTGEGVHKSKNEAHRWYLLSAQQNNPRGQANLGCMLADEYSEFHDYSDAAKWLSMAAAQGSEVAQEKLAELYYWGRGVEKNYPESAKWYRLAAAQGSMEAERMLTVMQIHGQL